MTCFGKTPSLQNMNEVLIDSEDTSEGITKSIKKTKLGMAGKSCFKNKCRNIILNRHKYIQIYVVKRKEYYIKNQSAIFSHTIINLC